MLFRSRRGPAPAAGARPATRELQLEDYEGLFMDRAIHTGQREMYSEMPQMPLYRRVLGSAFDTLPAPLADLHNCVAQEKTAEGTALIETGKHPLARAIRFLFGFPKAGRDVPVRVIFRPVDGGELWQRDFAGTKFSSFQSDGKGRFDKLLLEKFGPVTVALALVWEQDRLNLILRHWNIFGIPLPVFLGPNGKTYEYVADGSFCFHVEIAHWLTGSIVKYQGRLTTVG